MASVISGDANVSAAEFGYLDGVTSALQTQLDAKLNLAGGKILQIVRATDATDRTTSSGSFVDASLSVTITPQKNDSAILIIYNGLVQTPDTGAYTTITITDSSNNAISGAENVYIRDTNAGNIRVSVTQIAYATPATTSSVTYKLRFNASTGTATLQNSSATAQLYAIEVSA